MVIVGGGLSGLCCAYRIAQKRPDISVVIHERSNRLGGVINTWQEGEWICDLAVNATRPHPAFWRLIKDLGLSEKFRSSRHKRSLDGFCWTVNRTSYHGELCLKSVH